MAKDFLTEAFVSLKDSWKAEDALQEAFLRLWGRKYQVGSLQEAQRLLARTGRNIEIDEYRKARRTVVLSEAEDLSEAGGQLDKETLFRKVEASMGKDISPLQRRIIKMHEYEGVPFEDIARELGMQPAAVRMQASRARKTIRDKFRNEYGKD